MSDDMTNDGDAARGEGAGGDPAAPAPVVVTEAITQVDRIAASDAFYTLPESHWPSAMWMAEMENGEHDDAPLVQAFARHRRLASQDAGEGLREAAQAVLDRMFGTYKARNGREVGIQGDDGEKCWIVHSDDIETLRRALDAAPPSDAGSTTPSGGEGVNWSLPIEAIHGDGRNVPMVVAQLNAGVNPGNDHWLLTADGRRFPGRPGSHRCEWASKDGALPSQPGWRIRNVTTPPTDASPDSGEANEHARWLEAIAKDMDFKGDGDWAEKTRAVARFLAAASPASLSGGAEEGRVATAWSAVMRAHGHAFGSVGDGYSDEVREMRAAVAALPSPEAPADHRNIHGEPIPEVPLTPYADPEAPANRQEAGEDVKGGWR